MHLEKGREFWYDLLCLSKKVMILGTTYDLLLLNIIRPTTFVPNVVEKIYEPS